MSNLFEKQMEKIMTIYRNWTDPFAYTPREQGKPMSPPGTDDVMGVVPPEPGERPTNPIQSDTYNAIPPLQRKFPEYMPEDNPKPKKIWM